MPQPESLEQAVREFLSHADNVAWDRYRDFNWSEVNRTQPHPLSEQQIAATRTAMLVEDHLPGYGREYWRLFPVDESVSREQAWRNRQLMHFIARWCAEEDRHAHVLELYLRETQAVDPQALTDEMVREGVKRYRAPHDEPTQLFVYTAIQEKATQLFYQCLRSAIDEPVLESVLRKLSQDEARHCAFFSDMIRLQLAQAGDSLVPLIKEAVDAFKLPLWNLLDNYKRQAVTMIRAAAGYDHREGFAHLALMVRAYADSRTNSHSHELDELLLHLNRLAPAN